jgi:hypothetical protein
MTSKTQLPMLAVGRGDRAEAVALWSKLVSQARYARNPEDATWLTELATKQVKMMDAWLTAKPDEPQVIAELNIHDYSFSVCVQTPLPGLSEV